MKKEKDVILLERIANHLVINSSFLSNLGLFHGKMGIVIFFYHYSRYLNNPIYEEFAGELLDEIFEEIHDKLPIDFENGYLGIGWGIEYLAYLKFIDGNTNEILEDIDTKIMERDIRRISDKSLETGLEGLFHYVLFRLYNNRQANNLFDKPYFSDFFDVANYLQSNIISESLTAFCDEYKHWYDSEGINYNPSDFLKDFYSNKIPDDEKVYEWKLGLVNGCAGIGLNTMCK